MAFRRFESQKDLELPTFIDIIFLLLIFFLLTYSPVQPKKGESALELTLPFAEGQFKVNPSERVETLVIEILPAPESDSLNAYIVHVLLPFREYGYIQLRKKGITLGEARRFAREYNRYAYVPYGYERLPQQKFRNLDAVKLIDTQLERFARERLRVPKPTNNIEIRADRSVKFRLINHILTKCSELGDLIPVIIFRTMFVAGEEYAS